MKNISDQFTLAFIIGPKRYREFYNAFSSMLELNPQVKNVILIFNDYDNEYDKLLDVCEIRQCDIIKLNKFHNIAETWNLSLILSDTRYVLILNDDIVFKDENLLEKVFKEHKKGSEIVFATEIWSGFSIDKKLISKVGWFDENFPHSWEDIDYRYRIERSNIKTFRFEPQLIRHLRCQKGKRNDFWDKSSEYFFEKWNISELVRKLRTPLINTDFSISQNRKILQSRGFFRYIDSSVLDPKFKTVDYYPKYTALYKSKY